MNRIDNVTKVLDKLQEKGQREFAEYPDQTIYDLYYEPLKRDSHGKYRLGIEDIPRSVDHPQAMDPLFQEIPGLPEFLENSTTTTRTTVASRLIDTNRTSHLEKGHTSVDDTSNATRSPVPASHLEKGFTWYNLWGNKNLSPRMIGWIMLAMAGVIILLIYASFILLVRKCCAFLCQWLSSRNHRLNSPELPLEPLHELANFDNLSTVNHVNLYEVVPVPSVAQVPPPPISN